MNRAMYEIVCGAEGRYLSAEEVRLIGEYAAGYPQRVAASRRIGGLEDRVVGEAVELLQTSSSDPGVLAPDEWRQVLSSFVRNAARHHVVGGIEEFRNEWSPWAAELLRTRVSADAAREAFELLRAQLLAHLDAADSRILVEYVDMHLAEIRKSRTVLR